MNYSCHLYEWVMSYLWSIHITYTNESCKLHASAMSRICMRHVALQGGEDPYFLKVQVIFSQKSHEL